MYLSRSVLCRLYACPLAQALDELLWFLLQECKEKHINISLPSLRIDAFSLDVMSKVQDVKKSSLTFAPEAGSQRLRNVINKGLGTRAVHRVRNNHWNLRN